MGAFFVYMTTWTSTTTPAETWTTENTITQVTNTKGAPIGFLILLTYADTVTTKVKPWKDLSIISSTWNTISATLTSWTKSNNTTTNWN